MEDELIPESSGAPDDVATALTPAPTPLGVKMCGIIAVFLIGIAMGGAGHTVYTAYFDTMSVAEMSAAGTFVGRIDLNASVCSDPWGYACNRFQQHNYLTNSFISDTQVPEFVAALDAFESVTASKSGPAEVFYRQCKQEATRLNVSVCEGAYVGMTTLAELWRAGASHSKLKVGRTASPYRRGFRSLVVLMEETINFGAYPTVISDDNDDCGLMELARALSSVENDEIMVYGDVASVCSRWTALRDDPQAVTSAIAEAVGRCERRLQHVRTPLDCFLLTAGYWPQTNRPYMDVKISQHAVDELTRWFATVKAGVLKIAAPLGPGVVAKLKAVTPVIGWSDQNLGSGPSMALILYSDTARAVVDLEAWAMERELSETVHVKPRFQMAAYAINAYYTSAENSVYLPAGLHALLHSIDGMTIGQLGSIVAHELWHAVDPTSIQYDALGAPSDLLSPDAAARYAKFVECIKGADDTLSEDFADYQAITTVQQIASTMPKQKIISTTTVDFTAQDIALLSFAMFWCTTDGPTAFNMSNYHDPHSPPRFRVEHSLEGALDTQFGCDTSATRCML